MNKRISPREVAFPSALVATLLLISVQRLPAPIQEITESPAPSAAVQTPKPKKLPAKEKSKTDNSETSKNDSKQPSGAKKSPFAGKWVGTMPEVPWGNVATELLVDQTGSTLTWTERGKFKGIAKTQIAGDTLVGHFQVGVPETWSLTVRGDGTTAHVRLQAVMNDQTAIFHRVSR